MNKNLFIISSFNMHICTNGRQHGGFLINLLEIHLIQNEINTLCLAIHEVEFVTSACTILSIKRLSGYV